MNYRQKLKNKQKKSGRTWNWIYANAGIPRTSFWRKVDEGTLSDKEKKTIENLLIK